MGFRVSVFGLQFPVLWFPVLWLDRVCLLKSSQGQSLHHDLCLDSIKKGFSSFCLQFTISLLWFPVLWIDRVCLLKSTQRQSLHHDLCLDSVENGILSFRLRFMISHSLISRPLAWSCLSLEVLSGSEPPSWSLLRFHRERDFEFPSLVSEFLFSGLIVSLSWGPLMVRASIMIFA